MGKQKLPLKNISIEELFSGGEKSIYEIPIYQRNYAWEKDEITALIQDVYDAYEKGPQKPYYIGTLVSYHKGDRVYEVIDGQQRLTTIRIILGALNIPHSNLLTYRARKKSDKTIKAIPYFDIEEKDIGIENGYKYVVSAIGDIVPKDKREAFVSFFMNNVHIIHYQVPKDIDLNHYFEIMNSRGEQLEKHEIVKANLMEVENLEEDERNLFNNIWECCSEMSVYTQQNFDGIEASEVFGTELHDFIPKDFDGLLSLYKKFKEGDSEKKGLSISEIIKSHEDDRWRQRKEEDAKKDEKKDSFQPIIDFPNFLLIVLKITLMSEESFSPNTFNLDDKELLNEFREARMNREKVKLFAFNLLKARYLLDNYIVHHSKEEDTIDSNPWKLQVWHRENGSKKEYPKNLVDSSLQDRLAHLLSMFEVSFTARQRKNYLFYCLLYLMKSSSRDVIAYANFVENLAKRYFYGVYLDGTKLNAINTPVPGSFDSTILKERLFDNSPIPTRNRESFVLVYGDGSEVSKGVPLFVFNYLDYKLWELYDKKLRGKKTKENDSDRKEFFGTMGCSDFGLKVFDQFYFSRTRRSLEHYYPQVTATGKDDFLNQKQINCIGNYAMIGSEANSSGSNWSPKTKLDHYLDLSGKISQISVASLKFMIMMQICKDNGKWEFDEIKAHQEKMISALMG